MSRIVSIEVLQVDLIPRTLRIDALGGFEDPKLSMVRIRDDEGASGIGCSGTPGTLGSAVIRLLDEQLAPMLRGRDAAEVERLWLDMLERLHAGAAGVIGGCALAAMDTALWDLRARKAALPLHLLAGGARRAVPRYACDGGWLHLGPAQLADEAARAQAAGFCGSRVQVGRSLPGDDLARVAAVREATGPEWEIMLETRHGMGLDEAVRLVRRMEPLDPAWFESPVLLDDPCALRQLAASTGVPLAMGASLCSVAQFRQALQGDACAIARPDIARLGGITPWLKVAHLAEAFGVPVCPPAMTELHLALCCAVPNGRWLAFAPELETLTQERVHLEDGRALPSAAPGLGIAWDWERVADRLQSRSLHE